MKKSLLLITLLISFAGLLNAQSIPDFYTGVYIQANGSDLVGGYGSDDTAPCAVDWNNDGLKDLLVGQTSMGKIRLYINSGTNTEPLFTNFSFLQADGSDIVLPDG